MHILFTFKETVSQIRSIYSSESVLKNHGGSILSLTILNKLILTLDKFGQFIGKTSERITVREKGDLVQEVPFFQVEQILVVGNGISFSSDLINECAERGIPITFLTSTGKPLARLASPDLVGTVATRREQLLAYSDRRSVLLAKLFIEGKIRNQMSTLKYFARHRKEANREVYEKICQGNDKLESLLKECDSLDGAKIDEVRELLLSIEGRAASVYWEIVGEIFPAELNFTGRERRGATDPVNSALNYGYGILYSQIWNAVVLAGLDPFAGFLHADRPGKPSLVLDLIEEFRSFVVDRTVISYFSKGGSLKMDGDCIADDARRDLGNRVLNRLNEEERFKGKKHKVRTIVQLQSRHLATFLRGEGKYKPFVGSW